MRIMRLRVICLVLTLSMICGFLPQNFSIVFADEADDAAYETGISDTPEPDGQDDSIQPMASLEGAEPSSADVLKSLGIATDIPVEYTNSTGDPLGEPDKNGNVQVRRYSELALSSRIESGKNNIHREELYSADFKGIKKDAKSEGIGLANKTGGIPLSPTELRTLYQNSNEPNYMFENAIPIDIIGMGSKSYVASIRVDANQLRLQLRSCIPGDSSGLSKNLGVKNGHHYDKLDAWERMGYLPITVGDFDGDGISEIAVCYPEGSNDNYNDYLRLEIFGVTVKDGKPTGFVSKKSFNLADVDRSLMIDRDYRTVVVGSRHRNDLEVTPNIHLQAGNLRGGKTDSLIITTEMPGVDKEDEDSVLGLTERAANVFIYDDPLNSTYKEKFKMFWELPLEKMPDYSGNPQTMLENVEAMRHAATVVDDVDGDGTAELIVAGNKISMYYYTRESDKIYPPVQTKYVINGAQYLMTAISYKGGKYVMSTDNLRKDRAGNFLLPALDMQKELSYKSFWQDRPILEPAALVTYRPYGQAKPPSIFLEGNVYTMERASSPDVVKFYKASSSTLYGTGNASIAWMSKAIAGNFDKNENGMEQVIFTYAYKKSSYVVSSDYTWVIQQVTGALKDNFQNVIRETSDGALDLAAVDVDNDSAILRYRGDAEKEYYFSDPQIIAVLQAAPYFDELTKGKNRGQTRYGTENSEGSSKSSGTSVSAGTLLNFSQDISAIVKLGAVEMEVSGSVDVSNSEENTFTKSTSVGYSTDDHDKVVLAMTPYVNYKYDIYVPESVLPTKAEYDEWVKTRDALQKSIADMDKQKVSHNDEKYISANAELYDILVNIETMDAVIKEGVYTWGQTVPESWDIFTMSIPSTPRTSCITVSQYDMAAEATGEFSAIYGNVIDDVNGDPLAYKKKTERPPDYVTAGETEAAKDSFMPASPSGGTTDVTLSYTSERSTTRTDGASINGKFAAGLAGFKVGMYGSASDYNGYTYTSSDGVQYQGIVANLPDAVHDDDAPPKEILDNYSLNWQFGVYKSELDDNAFSVLGYFVDGANAPPTPPVPWNEAQGKNSVTLKWNHGSRPGATYTISSYDKTKANPYEILGTVAGTETTFVCEDLIPNSRYSFVIHSTSADGKNGVYSDSVDVTTSTDGPAPVIIKQPGNDDGLIYAKSGNPAVMSIIAEKYPEGGELSYQWQQHTDKGWENVKTPSANSPELTTENVTKAMDGRLYRCIVSQTIDRSRIEAQSGAAELKVDADVIATQTTINVLLKNNPSQPINKGNIAHIDPDTGEKAAGGDALLLRARVDAEHSDDILSGSLSFTIRKNGELVDRFLSQLAEEDGGLHSAVIEWMPTAVGNYEITAEYFGHEIFSGSEGKTAYEAVDEKTPAYEHLEFGDDAEITYGDMLNLSDELKMYVYSMSESAPMDYSSVTYSVIEEDGETADDFVIEGYFVPKKAGEFRIIAVYEFLGDTYTAYKNVTVAKRDVTITCADISHDRSVPVELPNEEDLTANNLMEDDELFTTVAGEKLWFYTPKTDIPVTNGKGKQGVYEINIVDNAPAVNAEKLDEFNSAKELFLANYNVIKQSASYTITGEEFHVKYSGSSNGTLSAVAEGYGGTENPFNSGDGIPEGATLRFTAAPSSGFIVGQWKINGQILMDGEKAINSNEYTIDELSADTSVEVKFVPDMHRLTYESGDFGSLSAVNTDTSDEIASGSLLISNTAVTFTATPDTGGFIRQWIVNGVPVNGDDGEPYTGTTYYLSELLDDTYVSVSFGQKGKHLIETEMINEDGNTVFGNKLEVSGTEYDPDAKQAVDGSSVTFTATPGKNSIVYEWRQYADDGAEQDKTGRNYNVLAGSSNTYTIENVLSDLEIAVVFFCADDLAFGTSQVIEDNDNIDENSITVSNLGHNTYEVRTPQLAILKALSSNTKSLIANTPVATVTLDEAALQSCTGGSDLVITIAVIDTGTLPLYLQNVVDDRPALAISAAVGERALENFGGGDMIISVPYMFAEDENDENVFVICLPSGAIADIEAIDGNLEFIMTAPGGFVVVHNPVDLKDVDDHIFKDAIKYAVSRGLMSFGYEDMFRPEVTVTRGMFIMGLGKRYGVNPDDYVDQLFSGYDENWNFASEPYDEDYQDSFDENEPWDSQDSTEEEYEQEDLSSDMPDEENYAVMLHKDEIPMGGTMIDPSILPFSDVSPYDETAPYILWAYQNGIIDDTDGDLFRPDDAITREEMAIILYNYAIFAGISVPDSSSELRERAVKAAEHVLGAKIMETLGNTYFEMKTNVSRAELSVSLQGIGRKSK